ncbi:MAG: hypothetical protein LBM08_03685, partial [Dysgonamonadaceae bacterium]|nr:hypothetical protein [Dysgonamonadaceae bacterium]
MNRIAFIIVLSVLISAGYSKNKETVITGTFTGSSDVKNLFYTVPLSGTSYMGFNDTLYLDEAGNFEVKLSTNRPSFIQIWSSDPYM